MSRFAIKIIDDPNTAMPGDYVKVTALKDWPAMTAQAATNFRRFSGNREATALVRKGPRIFSLGTELAKCVYNHTREF